MRQANYHVFEHETHIPLSRELSHSVINDIMTQPKKIKLPSEFKNEMLAIKDELNLDKKWSLLETTKKSLTTSGYLTLEIVTLHLAILQFGVGPVIAYYIGGTSVSMMHAALKTVIELDLSGPLRNIDHSPINKSSNQITFGKLVSNFSKNLIAWFPLETMFSNQIADFSKSTSACKIAMAYCDYMVTLSHERIFESIHRTIIIPEKTCFTTHGKRVFISAKIERHILNHFKLALRRFGRIIDEELPREISQHKSLSWIQKSINGLRRLVEPLTIPLQIITQTGKFNPLLKQIKKTAMSISQDVEETQEDSRENALKINIMTISAQELFLSHTANINASNQISEHESRLSQQAEFIQKQQAEIERLRMLVVNNNTESISNP